MSERDDIYKINGSEDIKYTQSQITEQGFHERTFTSLEHDWAYNVSRYYGSYLGEGQFKLKSWTDLDNWFWQWA